MYVKLVLIYVFPDLRVMDTSRRCRANMNPDRQPVKNRIVSNRTTLISLWLLHMTISATSKMYMDMPTDDSKFSAMKTSLNVPSDRTRAIMMPTAKKQQMTRQYILVTKDCNSRNFISSYTLLGLSLPDSMSGAIIRSVSLSPVDERRDMFRY